MFKTFFYIIIIFLFTSCDDNVTVIKYNKDLKDLKCVRLVVFPPNSELQSTFSNFYKFKQNCKYALHISQKGGIICNSNQNAPKKALTNFPSGYIRLDLYNDSKLLYSYYRDLTSPLTKDDMKKSFNRFSNDLLKK